MHSVQDLHEKCFDQDISESSLLRMALAVARKEEMSEFEKWAALELSGYDFSKPDELPDYRKVEGILVYKMPYRHLQPVQYATPEIHEQFAPAREAPVYYSVPEIEHFLEGESRILTLDISEYVKNVLRTELRLPNETSCALQVNKSEYVRIIEKIRTEISKFTMNFNVEVSREISQLSSNTQDELSANVHVSNSVIGSLNTGSVSGSSINVNISNLQNSEHPEIAEAFEAVQRAIRQEVAQERQTETQEQLNTLIEQANLPPSERRQGIIKPILGALGGTLSAAGGAAEVWSTCGDTIIKFFGG